MSSILKALKKLENDKSMYKPEQLRIDSKILQEGSSFKFSRTAVLLIAVALFMCVSGATFFYLKRGTSVVSVSPAVAPQRDAHMTTPTTPTVLEKGKLSTGATPSSPPKTSPVSKTAKRMADDAPKIKQQSQPENKTAAVPLPPTVPASEPAPVPAPELRATTPEHSVIRPVLTVNGIAFQEGSRDNMAMINGIAVSSGEMIEGVRVEDIQKNRVIFSQGGEKFEIRLNKSNK